MRNYNRALLSARGLALKKRIVRNRRRAIFVGLIYFLATLAFAAAVVALPFLNMPLLQHDKAPVGVMQVVEKINFATIDVTLVNCVLYALVAVVVVINALRAFGKLGWLFKRVSNRASKKYGFNFNVFAMEDLGIIFSASFAMTLIGYFLIAVLCGDILTTNGAIPIFLPAVLGVGVFVRLFAGVVGAKTAYFDYDVRRGGIAEQRRVVGRFAPFFRNLLQNVSVLAIMYFFLKTSTLHTVIGDLLGGKGLNTSDMNALIGTAMQLLIVLCLFVLAKHAMAITEYNINGAKGFGMRYFRVFSFFVFAFAAVAALYPYFMVSGTELNTDTLVIAVIALVMFIIERMMRKCPKFPDEKKQKKAKAHKEKAEKKDDDMVEISFNTATHSYASSYVAPMSKKGTENLPLA